LINALKHRKFIKKIIGIVDLRCTRREIWPNAKTGARTHRAKHLFAFLCVRKRVINRHGGAYCPKSLFIYARSAAGGIALGERSEADFMLCALGYKSSPPSILYIPNLPYYYAILYFSYIAARHLPGRKKIVPSEFREKRSSLLVYLSANCFQSIVRRAQGAEYGCAGMKIYFHIIIQAGGESQFSSSPLRSLLTKFPFRLRPGEIFMLGANILWIFCADAHPKLRHQPCIFLSPSLSL